MRRLFLMGAIAIHHLILHLAFRRLSTPRLIQFCKSTPRLARLTNDDEFQFALQISRRLADGLRSKNVCFDTSLLLFWLGDRKTVLHFGVNGEIKNINAHAWVERAPKIYTTDLQFKTESLHHEVREL